MERKQWKEKKEAKNKRNSRNVKYGEGTIIRKGKAIDMNESVGVTAKELTKTEYKMRKKLKQFDKEIKTLEMIIKSQKRKKIHSKCRKNRSINK